MKTTTRSALKNLSEVSTLGTPKTLDEAIGNVICYRPHLKRLDDHAYDTIRDFMAQKFGVAYIQAGDDKKVIAILEDLFLKLTQKES